MPDPAADAATFVPPSWRTRLLAPFRRCGFGYECFRIFRIGLETAPPTEAEVLPEGRRFRELAGADGERADDASIRGCAWYGGAVSVHLRNVEAECGGGFATALKQLSAVEMRRRGFPALYSRIWWSNHASLSVWRKAGWTRIGTTPRTKLPLFAWTPTFQWK